MKENGKHDQRSDEDKFLDQSGYTIDIPKEEMPTSEDEFNKLLSHEGNMRKLMRIRGIIVDPSMDVEKVVSLIRSKGQEKLVLEWTYIHRKNRTIMRKLEKTIAINPTTQLLLRAADLLKN